ncbi:hypothetical protein DD5_85 [Mycobacterium phage DD5]|uniref:Uncharacterized protein n=2 Tax=Fromanvirus lockley TaxID=540067 RepID=B3VH67_9CAUD|nr:hypothetical protein Lockley_88 [Mycobacterium phage Lockley]YP_001994816.1 hypothetical protein DD5_85 [Mycobacterium phage DD5]ACE79925.1 hypothetical protein Lockley_88 [Mycobacterium phage Lockley]ACE80194.1 hypothetical protein DD5_85 [Mycobacterium phage DD5]
MATIYQCPLRLSRVTVECVAEDQGRRAKCRGCGSALRAIEGHAVLIPHSGGSRRYNLDDAVREYATLNAARKAADRAFEENPRSNLVARFLEAR